MYLSNLLLLNFLVLLNVWCLCMCVDIGIGNVLDVLKGLIIKYREVVYVCLWKWYVMDFLILIPNPNKK